MIRSIFNLFSSVVNLITAVITLIIVGIVVYFALQLFPGLSSPVPEGLQPLLGQTEKASTCMVEKAWDALAPESREAIQQDGSLRSLRTSEIQKVTQHLSECTK